MKCPQVSWLIITTFSVKILAICSEICGGKRTSRETPKLPSNVRRRSCSPSSSSRPSSFGRPSSIAILMKWTHYQVNPKVSVVVHNLNTLIILQVIMLVEVIHKDKQSRVKIRLPASLILPIMMQPQQEQHHLQSTCLPHFRGYNPILSSSSSWPLGI